MLLKRGQRGILLGRTGSGKTQNAIFQLRNAPASTSFILDTKIEDAFFGVPEEGEEIELIESVADLKKLAKVPRVEMPDYVLIRPSISEVIDVDALDEYSQTLYEKFGACFIYFDELYNWHNRGQAGAGLLGLLTRGRSRGKTVLGASQRPAWVSRFCLTEADKYYVHALNDRRDKKTVSEIVPDYADSKTPPQFHFHYYEPGKTENYQLYKPVPFQELNRKKVFRKKWL